MFIAPRDAQSDVGRPDLLLRTYSRQEGAWSTTSFGRPQIAAMRARDCPGRRASHNDVTFGAASKGLSNRGFPSFRLRRVGPRSVVAEIAPARDCTCAAITSLRPGFGSHVSSRASIARVSSMMRRTSISGDMLILPHDGWKDVGQTRLAPARHHSRQAGHYLFW